MWRKSCPAKTGKTTKNFAAVEWLDDMRSHIPEKGKQMIRNYLFWDTIRDYSSNGYPHSNFKMKVTAL
jgi:hypothetical protein